MYVTYICHTLVSSLRETVSQTVLSVWSIVWLTNRLGTLWFVLSLRSRTFLMLSFSVYQSIHPSIHPSIHLYKKKNGFKSLLTYECMCMYSVWLFVYMCVLCLFILLQNYRIEKKMLGCGNEYEDDEISLSVLWRFSLALIWSPPLVLNQNWHPRVLQNKSPHLTHTPVILPLV